MRDLSCTIFRGAVVIELGGQQVIPYTVIQLGVVLVVNTAIYGLHSWGDAPGAVSDGCVHGLVLQPEETIRAKTTLPIMFMLHNIEFIIFSSCFFSHASLALGMAESVCFLIHHFDPG